jgi:hypothetical protein
MVVSPRWSLASLTPPWSGPSLYLHIRDNPNSHDLPDEKQEPNQIRFAPGAWDGVVGHHLSSDPAKLTERLSRIERPLEKLLLTASDHNLKELYQAVTSESIYAIADEIANRVAERVSQQRAELGLIGRYFAAGADQREATKFGIILVGIAGENSDVRLLETLAGHEEFTLYAAISITRLVDDPEQSLWRIAQKVHGWGRVQLVERLDGTSNPEIQDWMLREGFRNSVMDNYLAEVCARNGRLHEALQRPGIDLPLLRSTADLLSALLDGGPSAGMDDYTHAPQALQGYVDQVSQHPDLDLRHFAAVDQILGFLNDEPSWQRRLANGWTSELRHDLRVRCEGILRRESWQKKIDEGLESTDPFIFHLAETAGSRMGRDMWSIHFKRARAAPLGNSWYRLMQLTQGDDIDYVLQLAIKRLPLDKIATGPADSLGLGPGFEPHQALDCILQDLPRFPERGWPLIEAGLQSPVVRNRNFALTALLAWPRERWPANAFSLLQKAEQMEPNQSVKERLTAAIKVQ